MACQWVFYKLRWDVLEFATWSVFMFKNCKTGAGGSVVFVA